MGIFATSTFGSAVFGGEPVSYLWNQIDAETTTKARRLVARGLTDGTSLQATHFSVGRGGWDPLDYHAATPVNPDAVALDDAVFGPDTIDYYEYANERCAVYYCLLDFGEANVALGEVGIWGVIQNSPIVAENGTRILMAIGHFPLCAKNSDMGYVLRVTMQA